VVSLGRVLGQHLKRIPALSVIGLGCISAAAGIAFGLAALLLAVGVALILIEMAVASE
jgi:hypothetical protein